MNVLAFLTKGRQQIFVLPTSRNDVTVFVFSM